MGNHQRRSGVMHIYVKWRCWYHPEVNYFPIIAHLEVFYASYMTAVGIIGIKHFSYTTAMLCYTTV